ncbi:MAG: hypothetical protein M3203_03900 [Actinomycetota bacterium]|nr:hypothetical protein [Actinomycetota bacterium]
MLAETVSIDAGALLLALLVIVALVALVVAGFFCAPRAARGSGVAMGVWVLALVVEGAGCIASIAAAVNGRFDMGSLVPFAVVTGQVALFVQARANRRA